MMSQGFDELDVLIWLHGSVDPVLAGQVLSDGETTSFLYDQSYLDRADAIAVFHDLELDASRHYPRNSHTMAPSLRDSLPDRWGRRAVAAGLGRPGVYRVREDEVDELTMMMRTGPDRIGALDFRHPAKHAAVDLDTSATLEDLYSLADLVEAGEMAPHDLQHLIPKCASVGGARPKALYTDVDGRKRIAKFTAKDDTYPAVQAEFVAMRLAALASIDAASVEMMWVGERPVLLVERFDRVRAADGGWTRRAMVSALTWTQEHELSAHHISYPQLATIMADGFKDPVRDQEELLARLVFNILVGNTDDHARNHAAFWDGRMLTLTPAYDIAPQRRTTREANQALVLSEGSRSAQLRNAAEIASSFGVTAPRFQQIVDRLVGAIVDHWDDVCDEAGLSRGTRSSLAGRQFLNGFAFEGHGPAPRLGRR